jgi:hypothetical protein
MGERGARDKSSQRTNEWLLEQDGWLTDDESELLRAAVMFYVLAGWERYYPYPDMPQWLRPTWWYSPALARREARDG